MIEFQSAKRRALLVGIDDYDHLTPLTACVNDVRELSTRLGTHDDGEKNFSVVPLTSSVTRVKRACLKKYVRAALSPGAEVALLYFAGHGVRGDGDVVLCTQESNEDDEGVSFFELLSMINGSQVDEVIVILDCCFAGGAGGNPVFGTEVSGLRPGVTILSASRHNQLAGEVPTLGQGRFSYFLCAALDGGAADVLGRVGVIGAYSYLRESLGTGEQTPMLKCNVANLHQLRRCLPSVPLHELTRLPELFEESAGFVYPLDPSYEPTSPPPHPVHEAIFGMLQRFRAAKLIDPVDAVHMYDAAMMSTGCRLTPLGRHYRHLASRGPL